MPKLNNLLQMANAPRPMPPRDSTQDIAAIILASQTAMADVITRNFKGEIAQQVCAECETITKTLEKALRAFVKAEIAALPVPERVIVERITEAVTEREEEDEAEDMEPITVQRKDGVMVTAKKGDTTFDIIRNKAGFIKEIRPRG